MYNISKLEEAHTLLSKESLSSDDVRELLLYLVQRDDENRKAFKKSETVFIALLRIVRPLLIELSRVSAPMSAEMLQEFQDALRALDDAFAALAPPDVLQ